jgi:hypothetical protein
MLHLASAHRRAARPRKLAAFALCAFAALTSLLSAQDERAPSLPSGAEALRVPAGHRVSYRAFAAGVQIYRWDAAAGAWAFVGPEALLFADEGCTSPIGFHDFGPTWTSVSGSRVVGRFEAGFTVDPDAIPWLRLAAVESAGPGPFARTTYIQRVNTRGGRAPARAGVASEIARVPYTAEYYYYSAL